MNIRKIIDKERWKTHLYDSDDRASTNECHNASLERIEAAVVKRITKLEKQLEPATIQEMYELEAIKELHPKQINEVLVGMAKQIAELKEQLPKVVKPEPRDAGRHDGLPETYWLCSCGCYDIYPNLAYCYNCGSKLNWEEA